MVASRHPRRISDPIAIATKGRLTSQVKTQESSDKSRIKETDEDVPIITSTDNE